MFLLCFENDVTNFETWNVRFSSLELWEVLFSVKREADGPFTTQLIADRDRKFRIKYHIVYTENCS